MTESEARSKIKYRISTAKEIIGTGDDGKAFEDLEIAIQALKEIREYREIGTVEEFKAYKLGDCMNDCEHYDNCANYIYSKGYNEAIDKFAEELKVKLYEWYYVRHLSYIILESTEDYSISRSYEKSIYLVDNIKQKMKEGAK